MPIYTRTGDKGKTSLRNNERVWKNSARVSAYGSIDELNSLLGLAVAELSNKKSYQKYLLEITSGVQNDLFNIGASLADPGAKILGADLVERTKLFEEKIDEMDKQLSPLSNFILPGGGKAGALFHIARAVARRVEREIVGLAQEEKIDIKILPYLNRLSDLLFTMARYANKKERKKEIVWQP